ncbi:PLP-dependent aminotransferase family protein [Trinickia caryophylli]|nr:PLP-dependent aminotransferase family protein [Trinickia caryophylli]PMS13952.1 PLP-dependent aminotransferase family protein [Trinickia caryophylli]TRX14372.1 PLP-dependent aminotransferase family protein [Trinickia caryophylli]WQE14206.1 PLP-dependent aminotransferase family protein [Trinickia caryophylli]GLU33286.1 GntR family transcriptional regulator [Trinickia caryophylli]
MKLYEKLAKDIDDLVKRGVFRPGDRIPSVRQTSQHRQVSVTTVIRAYLLLESRGVIESRPQSGYYVRGTQREQVAEDTTSLRISRPVAVSAKVDVSRLVLSTLRSIGTGEAIPLGSPYPDPRLFPFEKINRYAYNIGKEKASWGVTDDLPPGNPGLIRQIARRYLQNGIAIDPGEIVVTVGATEAINLCLQAVGKPGDTVVVESPTFYAMLHAIERMGMRAIEVATDPQHGIDLDSLEQILKKRNIAACMVMPNFQNPLGFQMSDEKKQALVALAMRHDVPIIENDVYHELYFGEAHPSALKSYDTQGIVLHCASFSKSLSAAHRIGWAMPGRYREQVEKLKFLNTLTTPSIPQLAIAQYLENDGYERHLRRVRALYRQQARLTKTMVSRFFPEGTRTSQPMGGYVLWVELPKKVDSMKLYRAALEHGITIGPGYMFSASASYSNFIRLNYSYAWSAEIEDALVTIGKIVARLAR